MHCENCKFFRPNPDSKDKQEGHCFLNPPTQLPVPTQVNTLAGVQMAMQVHWIRPTVARNDYCAKHEPRPMNGLPRIAPVLTGKG
jgi:hypothetical protein